MGVGSGRRLDFGCRNRREFRRCCIRQGGLLVVVVAVVVAVPTILLGKNGAAVALCLLPAAPQQSSCSHNSNAGGTQDDRRQTKGHGRGIRRGGTSCLGGRRRIGFFLEGLFLGVVGCLLFGLALVGQLPLFPELLFLLLLDGQSFLATLLFLRRGPFSRQTQLLLHRGLSFFFRLEFCGGLLALLFVKGLVLQFLFFVGHAVLEGNRKVLRLHLAEIL
mmetsp:Transcript_12754/g.36017  ORF Transcript_12754/g.36017 Transcript_12754/m.36017 type:complete len:219 (-) Transcript_12754:1382-2038(-)